MPKVKIFWMEHVYLADEDTKTILRSTDPAQFEEVSTEELALLKKYLHLLPNPSWDMYPKLLVLDSEPIQSSLAILREIAKKQEEKAAKAKALKEATAQKKKELAAKNIAKKEKELLEKLKKKYE